MREWYGSVKKSLLEESNMLLQTEYEFILPKGYVDANGDLHRKGIMRLATAADEILPMKDPRVQQNPAYLTIIVMARVIVSLGTLSMIDTKVIEDLFSSDLAFLQDLYNRINGNGSSKIKVVCPQCQNAFDIEGSGSGED